MSEAPLSNEGNFLKTLKARLEQEGVFAALRDPSVAILFDKTIPEWIREFTGYIGGNEIPELINPNDFDRAQKLTPTIQQRLDRIGYCYITHLELYSKIKSGRNNLSAYVSIEVAEVARLKSADMRTAAIGYILSEYDEKLEMLNQLYDIIEQIRANLNKVGLGINTQIKLYETKARNYGPGNRT